MTRAADASFATSTSFKVTAFEAGATSNAYFTNEVFTATAGTTFTSGDKHYWPSAYNLDFYAWQPSTLSANSNNYTGFTITPSTTVSEQIDFVYAVTRGWGRYAGYTHDGSAGVTINFRHAESKVLIQLKNTNDNLKITVGNVTIDNLRGTETFTWNGVIDGTTPVAAGTATTDGQYTIEGGGTLSYLNGTWTATSEQNSAYTVGMGTDNITDDKSATSARNVFNGNQPTARNLTSSAPSYEMILIPQVLNVATTYSAAAASSVFNGANIKVQLKIQNKANDAYIVGSAGGYITAMWPLTALTWLPGHKYVYTVDLAGGGYHDTNNDTNEDLDPILEGAEIKFVTVTVDEWAVGASANVYNTGL